ncbi:MAG TPA: helix-turn-helix transcriptional regulator [Kofleriaceae bacterium]|nr:helix-turn-helix transcriptional regulator [Kofleriaceae bacterium]
MEISPVTRARVELHVTDRIEEFVSDPVGRCVLGPTYLIWCATPDLQGAIIWSTIDELALRNMMAIGRFILHPALAARRRLVVDCRDVTRVGADVLLGFAELAHDRVSVWATSVERQAVIVPGGLAGLLIGGALPSVGALQPLRFSHDLESALAFVDHPAARVAHELANEIAASQRGKAILLTRLHAQLAHDLTDASVESSASALGLGTRTMQRALARLGTSFSDELRRCRVIAAEALLLHSDLKIEAIALRVGFGNASRMSATLRRVLNVTASGLRARARH